MNDAELSNQTVFRILVVDDEEPIRNMIIQGIQRAGFECHYAEDGLQALKIMKKQPYHVVITDINMPHMDGIELTKHIKREL